MPYRTIPKADADFYAHPVSTSADLSILQQPFIGEEGFSFRTPPKSTSVESVDVTFDVNIVVPTGFSHFLFNVYVALMNVPPGALAHESVVGEQAGVESFSSWWAYPSGPSNRRRRRIWTVVAKLGWPQDFGRNDLAGANNATCTIRRLAGAHRIVACRAEYGVAFV